MWSAFRRLRALVTQGVACNPPEDDDEASAKHNKMSGRGGSKKRKKPDSFRSSMSSDGDGEHIDDSQEEVKATIWHVDVGEEAGENEDPQTKALRLFRFRILHYACNMEQTKESQLDRSDPKYRPSPDYDTVRACRLVSKDWYDEISAIFVASGKPVLNVNPSSPPTKKKKTTNEDLEAILETIKGPLVRPESLNSQTSDLSFPPFKLTLPSSFFYKEIENAFVYTAWPHFEQYMYELHMNLPADSTMRFYWPELHLENLKKIKFKCTNESQSGARPLGLLSSLPQNPFLYGNYMYLIQSILNGAKKAESFSLHCYMPHYAPALFRMIIPSGLRFLDVPLVKMTEMEMEDCLKYGGSPKGHLNRKRSCSKKSLRHLVIRAPIKTFRREDDSINAIYGSFLIRKYGSTLETLELDISGQEMDHIVWTMRREYVHEPLIINFPNPLPKLKSLTLHAGCWEIGEIKSLSTTLPALTDLKLTLITRESQIQTLYKSRSDKVERLNLCFVFDVPYEVIRGFSDNLPFLKELDISVKEKNLGLGLIFQSFLRLKKLKVSYSGCNTDEGKEALNFAVTGIPAEDWKAIRKEEMTIMDAIKKYEDVPSMRRLQDLEELELVIKSNWKMDITVMMRVTFLRMPNLKKLILSEKTIEIDDDHKDHVRKENQYGVNIEWI